MTYDGVRSVIRSIDLSRFPLKIRLDVRAVTDARAVITIGVAVRDIDTGQPCNLSCDVLVQYECLFHETFVQFVRDRIRDVVLHELDECLIIDRWQQFNPHGPPRIVPVAIKTTITPRFTYTYAPGSTEVGATPDRLPSPSPAR